MDCKCETHVGEAAFDCPNYRPTSDPFGAEHIETTREDLARLMVEAVDELIFALDPGARRMRGDLLASARAKRDIALSILLHSRVDTHHRTR